MHKIKRFGWKKDALDIRDFEFSAPLPFGELPPSVDLRSGFAAPYDQGQLGSCTANAIAAALQFDAKKQGEPDFMPSRLFIYYNERAMEGTVSSDSGAQIRDGVKSVATLGAAPESAWLYIERMFAHKPTPVSYTMALRHQAIKYQRVIQTIDHLQATLASGFPVVFGFTVYESFEGADVARTGIANLPLPGENPIGGHAVVLVGYDTASKRFLVRNSWGGEWGQGGYFTLPFEYLTNHGLASDFWVISKIE